MYPISMHWLCTIHAHACALNLSVKTLFHYACRSVHAHVIFWLHDDDVEEACSKIRSCMPAVWDAEGEGLTDKGERIQGVWTEEVKKWDAWNAWEHLNIVSSSVTNLSGRQNISR